MNEFCVYQTVYSGNKLPRYYIGSSSVEKVKSGYRGSVCSKQFKNLWKEELQCSPEHFRTFIISRYGTRKEALASELLYQIAFDVVKSEHYINKAYACKGFINEGGINSPMFGKHHTKEVKQKMSESQKGEKNHQFNKHRSEETKQKISNSSKGKIFLEETKQKISNAKLGTIHSEASKQKMSIAKIGKRLSEDHKQKISTSGLGRIHSDETKIRMSIARKEYWHNRNSKNEII